MKYRASTLGLERVEKARSLKGWGCQDIRWYQAAFVSVATLKRFRTGEVIEESSFRGICEAVGITDWQQVATSTHSIALKRQDWGYVSPIETPFYGRTEELETLKNWIIVDRCRLVAIRGLTGIGKTCLVRHLAESLKDKFDLIIWRSFYPNTLLLQELVLDLMKLISVEEKEQDYSLNDLMSYLHDYRCLIILDDIQQLLETKQLSGKYQQRFLDYEHLFVRMAQLNQGCLVVIGNEQPTTMAVLEERNSLVRPLTLNGLDKEVALQFLKSLNLIDLEGYDTLIRIYRGNPFFIKLISKSIKSLSNSSISKYLDLNTNLIGGISEWLDDQFDRISFREEKILYWLAILRFPISFQMLLKEIKWSESIEDIAKCLESLTARSLIEKQEEPNKNILYSLEPVLMKYVSMRMVSELVQEILKLLNNRELNQASILNTHALFLVSEKDEINAARIRYILNPLKFELINHYDSSKTIVDKLNSILLKIQSSFGSTESCIAKNIYTLINLI